MRSHFLANNIWLLILISFLSYEEPSQITKVISLMLAVLVLVTNLMFESMLDRLIKVSQLLNQSISNYDMLRYCLNYVKETLNSNNKDQIDDLRNKLNGEVNNE